MNRREFLKTSCVLSASLIVGFNSQGVLATITSATASAAVGINAFVKVAADGSVAVIAKHFEMGQGTTTGLATLIAEEMDLVWDQVTVEFAPSDNERYKNLLFWITGHRGFDGHGEFVYAISPGGRRSARDAGACGSRAVEPGCGGYCA